MKVLAIGVAASVFALAAASGAMAADPVEIDDVAITMATSHWDGPYAGVGVIGEINASGAAEQVGGFQGVFGLNVTADQILFGGEVYAMAYWSSIGGFGTSFGGEVRAGVLASDDLLLYAAAGAEMANGGNTYGSLGGGAEFWAMDDMSIDLEYKYYWGLNNANTYHHLGLSANWHF